MNGWVAPVLAISLLALSGCSHFVMVGEQKGELATIANFAKTDFTRKDSYRNFWIVSVDGQVLEYPTFYRPSEYILRISPGKHKFVVKVIFNTGVFKSTVPMAWIPMDVDLQPGQDYRIDGALRDNLYAIWLVDQFTRNRLTDETTGSYEFYPASYEKLVLILVPALTNAIH